MPNLKLDPELKCNLQRLLAVCQQAGIKKIAQVFDWTPASLEADLEELVTEFLLVGEEEGDGRIFDPDFVTSDNASELILSQLPALLREQTELTQYLRELDQRRQEARKQAREVRNIIRTGTSDELESDEPSFDSRAADYKIGLLLQRVIFNHLLENVTDREERHGYVLLDVTGLKLTASTEAFVRTTAEFECDLPVMPTDCIAVVQLHLLSIRQAQEKYAKVGAYDTEPDQVWQFHVHRAWKTQAPVSIPLSASGWHLYAGMFSSEAAATALAEATSACVEAIKAVPLGRMPELNRLLEKYVDRY